MSILLKGRTVISAHNRHQLGIQIDGEQIVEVEANLPVENSQTEDVTECYVLPSFIDMYTHLRLNNGRGSLSTTDNFTTESQAAVAKGTTTAIDMATPNKNGSLKDCLATWNQLVEGKSSCDYTYHTSMTEWRPMIVVEIQEMIITSITSFKMYMAYDSLRTTGAEISEAVKEVKKVSGVSGVRCENGDLVDELIQSYVSQGKLPPHYHPLSRPAAVETEAVTRYLVIVEMADLSVNIVHLNTKQSLEAVERARQRGQSVYVGTCPQYLLLNSHLYDTPNFEAAKYVYPPPLHKQEGQQALWQRIKEGAINTISTDHCNFNFHGQKAVDKDNFSKIPNGTPGVETRPGLVYTEGAAKGRITLEKTVALLSENIVKQFSIYPQEGMVQEGSDADLVVQDPRTAGMVVARTQLQNVDYTPYEGLETQGQARVVYLRGQKVAEAGRVILANQGKFVFRKAT